MMRYVVLFIITFISIESLGQSSKVRFDKGVGNFESHRTGSAVMRFIQRNDLNDLLTFYKETSTLDISYLKMQTDSISKAYTYSDSIQPLFYSKDSESTFYYERNFCHYKGKRIIIDLQVHVDLFTQNNKYFIRQLEFRRGKDIVLRTEEMKNILLLAKDENAMPPPPSPMPIR